MCRYRVNPSIAVAGETELVGGELVSGGYFPVLGIRPALGRLLTPEDDAPLGAHPYAVLSYAWWRSKFGGNPRVIGQTIRVNGYPITIIGVAEQGFDGMEPGPTSFDLCRAQCGSFGSTRIYRYAEPAASMGERLRPVGAGGKR